MAGGKFQLHSNSTCSSSPESFVPGGIHQNRPARRLRSLGRGEPSMDVRWSHGPCRMNRTQRKSSYIQKNPMIMRYFPQVLYGFFMPLLKLLEAARSHVVHLPWRLLGVWPWLGTTGVQGSLHKYVYPCLFFAMWKKFPIK